MAYLRTEGNLRFKIDRASVIVGRKFTVFALFYFVFGGNLKGRFNDGFLPCEFEGLIHGGAYFRNFKVSEVQVRVCYYWQRLFSFT